MCDNFELSLHVKFQSSSMRSKRDAIFPQIRGD